MRIAIVIRNAPFPIHDGLNLRIYNLINRLETIYSTKIFVLDGIDNIEKCKFKSQSEHIGSAESKAEDTSCMDVKKVDMSARFFGTDSYKLDLLGKGIIDYGADLVLGIGFEIAGYIGEVETDAPKIMDLVDSCVLFNWRQLKKGYISALRIKHFLASLSLTWKCVKKCKAVLTVSKVDTDNVKNISLSRSVYTVSNGVDLDYYCANSYVGCNSKQVLFSGSMQWPPNRIGIEWFLRECWKRIVQSIPDANLVIIGKDLDDTFRRNLQSYENVKAVGYVDDIRKYMWEAQVSIAPMISGSGIKNKILESWASGIPVVSTALGADGLICQDYENILIARNSREFSSLIVDLLNDPSQRMKLSRGGRRNVEEFYSWDVSIDNLRKVIERCL